MKICATEQRSRYSVETAASVLKRFYLLQRELVLMQAGWLPGTPDLGAKLALAEALWQDALVAGQLRQRVLELRYPERRIEVGDDAEILRAVKLLQHAPDGMSFFHALHHFLKPFLRGLFAGYLDATDHLDDSPTVRILSQALRDIDHQQEQARRIPEGAPGNAWLSAAAHVMEVLQAGKDEALAALPKVLEGGRPFAIARKAVRDPQFARPKFAWPDRLDPQLGAGQGMELQVRAAVHHLNEVWATEMAAAVLYDLAGEAPHEFLEDAARWCFDESRHCRMGLSRLVEFGFQSTEIPVDSFSYDAGATLDPVGRLGIIFFFETTYIHTKSERTKIFADFGDRISSHDMDFDWADELIHTHYGNKWLKFFLEKRDDGRTPKKIKRAAEESVTALQVQATPADRAETEDHYRRIMVKAETLALA